MASDSAAQNPAGAVLGKRSAEEADPVEADDQTASKRAKSLPSSGHDAQAALAAHDHDAVARAAPAAAPQSAAAAGGETEATEAPEPEATGAIHVVSAWYLLSNRERS